MDGAYRAKADLADVDRRRFVHEDDANSDMRQEQVEW
jgi:hypothetical protein